MSQFNWWRRHKGKSKLKRKNAKKGIPFLLQQIDHGDYDHSDYKKQAEQELVNCQKALSAFIKSYKGFEPTKDTRYLDIERSYRKRYNKLMEDYYQEETNRLMNLRVALIKEFGVDVWEETVMQAFKNDTTGARDFYFLYSNISEKELQTK